jgi:hypothetical protein
MRKIYLLLSIVFSITLNAQVVLQGYVHDYNSNETLIGATIVVQNGPGTVTDFNGFYQLELPQGKHSLSISYVGYEELKKTISL